MNSRNRATLDRVFATPTPHDVRLREVLALCRAAGVRVVERNAGLGFAFGDRVLNSHVRGHGVLDRRFVRDFRDLLRDGGVEPGP